MNYLTEIRLFYEWLETHHLAPSSITLWHALMYTANRSGWAEQIAIPISLLGNLVVDDLCVDLRGTDMFVAEHP